MVKKASNSSASTETTNGKMVLRKRTGGKLNMVVEGGGIKPTKKKTKVSKNKASIIDALKPKKPPTAFFYFLEDFRKGFQEDNPNVKSMRDIGKACGEKWKTMTYEEKVQYYDIATEKRAEFDIAMAEFNKKKESGELLEYADDSDFDE
ncbi:hypothetical protein LIER_11047 [Lithospermum erythrorhizon]|uniref:HMG box domain-containing protein n=1 Tax=Lithospermum erythrorhizon TaxID=34254 RepID=A0AAV3PNX9_LITER